MMDQLTLKNVRTSGKHGVFDEEKIKGNDFEVDVIFQGNFATAGASDDLSDTIDYSVVAKLINDVFEGPSVDLIERLAQQLIDRLTDSFAELCDQITVKVRKLNPPMQPAADWAEIQTSWHKSS